MMPPVVLGAGVLGLLAVAHGASRQRHPVLAVVAGALCGMAGLSAVALLAPMTGIRLAAERHDRLFCRGAGPARG